MPEQPLKDLFGRQADPQSPEEWMQLDFRAADIFSPHAPIDDEQLFAGRRDLIDGMMETIFQRGLHAILYGERGVGKTSLANILKDKIFAKAKYYRFIKRSCTATHNYRQIWQQLFDEIKLEDGDPLSDIVDGQTDAYGIFRAIDHFPKGSHPVFIIDEYDRITDTKTHEKMADTIKYLSDYSARATIIIIGVARDVKSLFGGHPSIERNVRQLPMPFMSPAELLEVFSKRLPDLGMTFDDHAKETVVRLSQGLPGYTHLLGQHAARNAIRRRSMHIDMDDLNTALYQAVDASDEKIKEMYANAVRSAKPSNQYVQALLACALTPIDERGYFSAGDVRGPFSRIMGKELDIPHYARHINQFCNEERGPALVREGRPKMYRYRFSNALLRPYAIIRGLHAGLISRESVLD